MAYLPWNGIQTEMNFLWSPKSVELCEENRNIVKLNLTVIKFVENLFNNGVKIMELMGK
jgi:hypothetical protein